MGIAFLAFGLGLFIYLAGAEQGAPSTSTAAPTSEGTEAHMSPFNLWGSIAGCIFLAYGAIRLLIDPGYMYTLRDRFIRYRDRWDETPWPRRNARITGGLILMLVLWVACQIFTHR